MVFEFVGQQASKAEGGYIFAQLFSDRAFFPRFFRQKGGPLAFDKGQTNASFGLIERQGTAFCRKNRGKKARPANNRAKRSRCTEWGPVKNRAPEQGMTGGQENRPRPAPRYGGGRGIFAGPRAPQCERYTRRIVPGAWATKHSRHSGVLPDALDSWDVKGSPE